MCTLRSLLILFFLVQVFNELSGMNNDSLLSSDESLGGIPSIMSQARVGKTFSKGSSDGSSIENLNISPLNLGSSDIAFDQLKGLRPLGLKKELGSVKEISPEGLSFDSQEERQFPKGPRVIVYCEGQPHLATIIGECKKESPFAAQKWEVAIYKGARRFIREVSPAAIKPLLAHGAQQKLLESIKNEETLQFVQKKLIGKRAFVVASKKQKFYGEVIGLQRKEGKFVFAIKYKKNILGNRVKNVFSEKVTVLFEASKEVA